MDLHIVLVEPEIPQNTGSIGRTCMAIGARLHLIRPLGFSLDDRYLKRAGLDYWDRLELEIHADWDAFLSARPEAAGPQAPIWFYTARAARRFDEASFVARTYLVFGKETAGLPEELLRSAPERCLRIPLIPEARSLNLSVVVGTAAYEALRQNGYEGLAASDPRERLRGSPGKSPERIAGKPRARQPPSAATRE